MVTEKGENSRKVSRGNVRLRADESGTFWCQKVPKEQLRGGISISLLLTISTLKRPIRGAAAPLLDVPPGGRTIESAKRNIYAAASGAFCKKHALDC